MLALILLFSWVISYAQVSPAPSAVVAPQPKQTTVENSLLWEISGNGLKTPSYLYGTIHLIPEEDFFVTEETQKALDASERVMFEINIDDMTSMGAQFDLLMKAFMPNGITIESLLSEEEYKLVSDHFEAMGLPMFMLQRIKPMFLSVMASEDFDPGAMMNEEEGGMLSYELEFADMAKKQKKEMGGLETIDFQMSMFDSIPYDVQAQMLVDAIEASGEGEEDEMDLMIELYKKQDLATMQSYFADPESPYAAYEELLLVNRNKNWIPIMAELMPKQKTFFAVGAGHLGGEYGVVNLLRAEGYTLTPLYDSKP